HHYRISEKITRLSIGLKSDVGPRFDSTNFGPRTEDPMIKRRTVVSSALFLVLVVGFKAPAFASEIDDLKTEMRVMQQSMDQMRKRLSELEQENQKQKRQAAASVRAPAPPAE